MEVRLWFYFSLLQIFYEKKVMRLLTWQKNPIRCGHVYSSDLGP